MYFAQILKYIAVMLLTLFLALTLKQIELNLAVMLTHDLNTFLLSTKAISCPINLALMLTAGLTTLFKCLPMCRTLMLTTGLITLH